MKIIIAGATGLIGKALVKRLSGKAEIVIISRKPVKASKQFRNTKGLHFVGWNDPLPLTKDTIAHTKAVINLSGAPIAGKRWTRSYKNQIVDSRIDPINRLAELIRAGMLKPEVVVQASATGYYQLDKEDAHTENSPVGTSFLSDVTQQWETASQQFEGLAKRVVLLRTGIVLSPDGGALPQMALPVKLFAGGPVGSGKQWVSWIHIEDQIHAIMHLLQNPKSNGVYNLTAPTPVRQGEMAKTLAKTLKRPYWLPAPSIAIRVLLGEMGDELLLKGSKVLPEKLLAENFTFAYSELDAAIQQIYP